MIDAKHFSLGVNTESIWNVHLVCMHREVCTLGGLGSIFRIGNSQTDTPPWG